MNKLRVGIIGQGRSGFDIHADSIKSQVPDLYDVVAIADPLEGRCDDAVKLWGATPYSDYREMLRRNDLDLVVNASPSHLHVPISIEVMDAGHNLLCEKPLARRAADVDILINKSRETGKLLAIYNQARFAAHYQQVLKVIESGVLGRIVLVKVAWNGFERRYDWQTLQEYNGGSLLNTGPHPLDELLGIFGRDIMPNILCVMDRVNTFGDAEDHVKLILHGDGRPTIDLEVSGCCTYEPNTWSVYGSNGGLTGSKTHLDWKYFKPEEAPKDTKLIRTPLPNRAYCSTELTWYDESWDATEEEADVFHDPAKKFYTNLYHVLKDGAELEVKPEEVRQQIAVIEECHNQNPFPRIG
jgi:predicted dehydrogenase